MGILTTFGVTAFFPYITGFSHVTDVVAGDLRTKSREMSALSEGTVRDPAILEYSKTPRLDSPLYTQS